VAHKKREGVNKVFVTRLTVYLPKASVMIIRLGKNDCYMVSITKICILACKKCCETSFLNKRCCSRVEPVSEDRTFLLLLFS
jgi:hypothetical protein